MYGHDGVLRYQNDARKNKVYNYVYLNGSLVGTRETDISTMAQTIKYQHTDALGTPIAVTDVNRAVIERNEYEPYGKRLTGPGQNRPGYTGHVEDAATGLTYMQQRYYDPAIGRFLSVDPVTANSATGANFNRYWYANNNPYRFTDPDGRLGELFWTSPTTVTLTIPYVLTGEALPFTTTELNAQFASHFSGTVEVNGRTVTVSAQAVQVPASTTARPANTVNVVHDTNGVTPSGRSQTNAIGGNVVTLGATGPEAASSQTGSHEFGHAAGAGDQYRGGLGANGQTLTQNVPGPANIMRELGPAGANQQTLREILTAPTNSNACAQGVSGAANGACQ
jgi:RHS repeat-associated protein